MNRLWKSSLFGICCLLLLACEPKPPALTPVEQAMALNEDRVTAQMLDTSMTNYRKRCTQLVDLLGAIDYDTLTNARCTSEEIGKFYNNWKHNTRPIQLVYFEDLKANLAGKPDSSAWSWLNSSWFKSELLDTDFGEKQTLSDYQVIRKRTRARQYRMVNYPYLAVVVPTDEDNRMPVVLKGMDSYVSGKFIGWLLMADVHQMEVVCATNFEVFSSDTVSSYLFVSDDAEWDFPVEHDFTELFEEKIKDANRSGAEIALSAARWQ